MKVISFSSQKGGTGKTTSAVNTATVLADKGKSVLFLDLDNNQTAYTAFQLDENPLYQVITCQPEDVPKFIKANPQLDYLFIDIPRFTGGDTVYLDLIRLIDYVLVPIKPTAPDVWAALRYLQAIEQISEKNNGKPQLAAFICQDHDTRAAKQTREIFISSPYKLFKKTIPRLIGLDTPNTEISLLKGPYKDRYRPFFNEFKSWINE